MWPCNSIIIAFVWFVVHGKLTRNFKCGHFRAFFKISYPCSFKSNSIPLDEIPEGTREFFPPRKLDASVPTDDSSRAWTWGQWCCPLRAPGNQEWDSSFLTWNAPSAPNAEDPRKCSLVKRSCSLIAVCSLARWRPSGFLPDESLLSVGNDDPALRTLLEQRRYAVCAFTNLRLKNWRHLVCGPEWSRFSLTATQNEFSEGLRLKRVSSYSVPHHPNSSPKYCQEL